MAITEHELPESLTPAVVRTLVKRVLTDELRQPQYRGKPNYAGHCYVATEAAYYLLGAGETGWQPAFIRHEDQPHWFLVNRLTGEVLDITWRQFNELPNYHDDGRGKGFLTNFPSRRAAIVIQRVLELYR